MTKLLFAALFPIIIVIFSSVQADARVRFVKEGASNLNRGESWNTACGDLQAMIDASVAGDEVWVAAGTYAPTHSSDGWTPDNPTEANASGDRNNAFMLKEGVKIYGGFSASLSGTEGSIKDRPTRIVDGVVQMINGTILSGILSNSSNRVVHVVIGAGKLTSETVLNGFTIRNGSANNHNVNSTVNGISVSKDKGGGIYLVGKNVSASASPKLENLIIQDNVAYLEGGGIYTKYSSPTILNAYISKNEATKSGDNYGGGIYCEESCPKLNIVYFGENAAYYGGGMYNYNDISTSEITLDNVNFKSNKATRAGGGIYNSGSFLTLNNCSLYSNIVNTSQVTIVGNSGGGGIYTEQSSSLTLNNVTIDGNTSYSNSNYGGGGISGIGVDLTLNNVQIINNKENNGRGGGIFLSAEYGASNTATLINVQINKNTSYSHGGGSYLYGASVTMESCKIAENVATNGSGGGIYSYSLNSLILDNVQVLQNNCSLSGNDGGGMFIYTSTQSFKATNVVISGNKATKDGGGIKSDATSSIFTNVLVSGNLATSGNGGGMSLSKISELTNVTVAYNKAGGYSGGVQNLSSASEVRNSIFWGNVSTSSLLINQNICTKKDTYNNRPILRRCLVQDVSISKTGDSIVANTDPAFIDRMDINNVPSDAGNFLLFGDSPAIDKGSNSYALNIDTDLRGKARINGIVDLGAYESSNSSSLIAPNANRVYVTVNGAGAKNGSSWSNAYPGLAYPLKHAKDNPGVIKEIWVKQGTYYPEYSADDDGSTMPRNKAFMMVEGVKLYGGFSGDESKISDRVMERNAAGILLPKYKTVLNGDTYGRPGYMTAYLYSTYHVVIAAGNMISGSDTARLDGFVVTGGSSQSKSSSLSIRVNNVDIECNMGAGIVCKDGAMNFAHISVEGNTAYSHGGGIYLNNDASIYTNLSVCNNRVTTSGSGGGVYITNGSKSVFSCVQISGNSISGASGGGGGVGISGGTAGHNNIYFFSMLISGNCTPSFGGGMYLESTDNSNSNGIFNNLTVTGNYGGAGGGGIYIYSSKATFRNSIIYGNNGNQSVSGGGTLEYNSCLVEGKDTSVSGIISKNDPKFVAPVFATSGSPVSGGNFRAYSNEVIDMGVSFSTPYGSSDIAGNPRIIGGKWDLGAYENSSPIVPDATGIVYVTVQGAGSMDGSSWDNAARGLAYPLKVAKDQVNIETIYVAEGTYYPEFTASYIGANNTRECAFVLARNVKIYGGFAPGLTGREGTVDGREKTMEDGVVRMKYRSVLSGNIGNKNDSTDNCYHVVIGADEHFTAGAVLDGFTIRDGYNENAISSYTQIISGGKQVRFYHGAGIYINSNTADPYPILSNLIVTNNRSNSYGGGIYIIKTVELNNVSVQNNSSLSGAGGGIYSESNSTKFTNCKIAGNSCTGAGEGGGGGICISGAGSPVLINCQITGNSATKGGGIKYNVISSSYFPTPTIINVTVAGNKATSSGTGAGIFFSGNELDKTVINSIIYGNFGTNVANSKATLYRNTLVEGGAVDLTDPSTDVGIVSNSNPEFISPITTFVQPVSTGNYMLSDQSPARDCGINFYNTTTTDLAGNPRKTGVMIDLGAYESFANIAPNIDTTGKLDKIYVTLEGKGKQDGSSWDNAYRGLGAALAYVKQNPASGVKEIWVAEGTYYPTYPANFTDPQPSTNARDKAFVLVSGVKIYGGFAPNLTGKSGSVEAREITAEDNVFQMKYKTILDGNISDAGKSTDNSCHVVIGSGTLTNTILDGFTIKNGYNKDKKSGNAISVNGNSVSQMSGAGIYLTNCSPQLSNLCVIDNHSSFNGGGIYIEGNNSVPVLTNISVINNTAGTYGGGICSNGSSISNVNLTNIYIYNNSADVYGGGMYSANASNVSLRNATLINNKAQLSGGGLYLNNTSKQQVYNSIIYNNSIVSGLATDKNVNSFVPDIYWKTLVEGATSINTNNIIFNSDPKLSSNGQPLYGSLVIDRGSNSASHNNSTTDIAGNPRKNNVIDLGAFELPVPPSLVPTGGIVYVTVNGAGNMNGSSWTNACRGLSHALRSAASNPAIKEIWVAKGTYYPDSPSYAGLVSNDKSDWAFALVNGVKVYGGFADNLTGVSGSVAGRPTHVVNNMVVMQNITYLDGNVGGTTSDSTDNCYHVVIAANITNNTTTLDGFTIRNGYNTTSTGVYTIVNGVSVNTGYGGGIYLSGCSSPKTPILSNIIVTANKSYDGGGIYNYNSSPILTNVRINTNKSTNSGAGFYNTSSNGASNPVLSNVQITNNIAVAEGGGIYSHLYNGSILLINAQITTNRAARGGGIYISSSKPATLTNVTIAGNHATVNYGGLYIYENESNQITRNSIIYGNSAQGDSPNVQSYKSTLYLKSLVGGAPSTNTVNIISNSDPLFVKFPPVTNSDDYRLFSGSPAINMGSNNLNSTSYDLLGNARIYGVNPIDLGAFESNCTNPSSPLSGNISAPPICSGGGQIRVYVNPTTIGLTYRLYDSSSGGNLLHSSQSGSGGEVTLICPSPTKSTTYYVETLDGTCTSVTRTPVDIIILKVLDIKSSSLQSNSLSSCDGRMPEIRLDTSETGVIYRIQDGFSGFNILGEVDGTDSEVMLPFNQMPVEGKAYIIMATRTLQGVSCNSSYVLFTVKFNTPPAPTDNYLASDSWCEDGEYHAIDTSGVPSGQTIVWYADSYSNNKISYPRSNTDTIINTYAVSKDLATGCESATRQKLSFVIHPKPTAPRVNVGNITDCPGNNSGTMFIFSNSDSTSIDNGVTWSPDKSIVNLKAGVYYVKVKTSDGCISDSTVAIITEPPVLNGGKIIGNKTVCSSDPADTIKSYEAPSGGGGSSTKEYIWEKCPQGDTNWEPIQGATGLYYALKSNPTKTTSYRRKVQNLCAGNVSVAYSDTVTITILNIGVPDLTVSTMCSGNKPTIQVKNSEIGITYKVYTTASGGDAVGTADGTGALIEITVDHIPPHGIQTYYVEASSSLGSCILGRKPVTFTVGQTPDVPKIASVRACSDGSPHTVSIPTLPDDRHEIVWYRDSIGNETTVQPVLNGMDSITVYATIINKDTRCESAPRQKVSVVVRDTKPGLDKSDIRVTGVTCASNNIGSITVDLGEVIEYSISIGGDTTRQESPIFTGLKLGLYDVMIKISNTCSSDAVQVQVGLEKTLKGGYISGSRTICSGISTGTIIKSDTSASGGNPNSYVYEWEYRTKNGDWTTISNSNLLEYSPGSLDGNFDGSLNQTTYYRRRVVSYCTSNIAEEAYSNEDVVITVTSNLEPPDVSLLDTVCGGQRPIISVKNSKSDITYNVYDSYGDIDPLFSLPGTGSTLEIQLDPAPPVSSAYYLEYFVEALLQSGTKSCYSVREPVHIVVNPTPIIPAELADDTVCAGEPYKKITLPPGQKVVWYTTEFGSTETTAPDGGYIGVTTVYAAIRDTTCKCESSRRKIEFTVNPKPLVEILAKEDSVTCLDPNRGYILVDNAEGPDEYGYSKDGQIHWQQSQFLRDLTKGTYFVQVKKGSCVSDSKQVEIFAKSTLYGGSIGDDRTVCYGTPVGTIASVSEATGGGGTDSYTYTWEYRTTENGNWTTIPNSNSPDSPLLGIPDQEITYYHRKVESSCGNNYTELAYSNEIKITKVNSLNVPNLEAWPEICSGKQPLIRIMGELGVVYNVYNDPTGGAPVGSPVTGTGSGAWDSLTVNETPGFNGKYYYVEASRGTCVSKRKSVFVPVKESPVIPSDLSSFTTCYDGEYHTITIPALSSNEIPVWYVAADTDETRNAPNMLDTGEETAYVAIRNTMTQCESPRKEIKLTINEKPALPSVYVTTVTCEDPKKGSIIVFSTAADDEYSIDDGNTWEKNYIFDGLGAGTYYVRIKSANGCISDFVQATVDINFDLKGGSIYSADTAICYNTSIGTLTSKTLATGGETLTYTWEYKTKSSGWNWISISNSDSVQHTPRAPLTDTTVYRRRVMTSCSGVTDTAYSNELIIRVNPLLTVPTLSWQAVCSGKKPSIEFTGEQGVRYDIYTVADGTSVGYIYGTGSSIRFEPNDRPAYPKGEYYMVASRSAAGTLDGKCSSSPKYIYVEVNELPEIPPGLVNKAVCYDGTYHEIDIPSLSSSDEIIVWYTGLTGDEKMDNPPGGSEVGTDITAYAAVLNQSSGCESPAPRKAINFTIKPKPSLSALDITTENVTCEKPFGGKITVSVSLSEMEEIQYYSYSKDDGNTWQNGGVFSDLIAGDYSIRTKNRFSCASDAVSVAVGINLTLTGGIIKAKDTVCYNTSPGTITSLSPAGGGSSDKVYTWAYSTDGNEWISTGYTGIQYPVDNPLTQRTYFRRVVESSCGGIFIETAISNEIVIEVNSALIEPSLSAEPICSGDKPVIKVTNFEPNVTYKVYTSIQGGSLIDSKLINDTIIVNEMPLSDTTYYVEASLKGCVSDRGRIDVSVNLSPVTSDLVNKTACYDGQPHTIDISSLLPNQTITWYTSASGDETMDKAPSRSEVGATPSAFAVITDNVTGCTSSPRKELSITINETPLLASDNIDIKSVSCESPNNGAIYVINARNAYEYSNDNGVSWQLSYKFENLAPGEYYVRTRAKISLCASDSVPVTMGVISNLYGGTISSEKSAVCYNTPAGIIKGTPATGGNEEKTYTWQYRTTGEWVSIPDSDSSSYSPLDNLHDTTYYRRMVKSTCSGVTDTAYSNTVKIKIIPLPSVPSSSLTTFLSICSGFNPIIGIEGETGVTYNVYKDSQGDTLISTGSGITDSTINITVNDMPSVSRFYYVGASQGGCASTDREDVYVMVTPSPEIPTGLKDVVTCYDGNSYSIDVNVPSLSGKTIVWYTTDTISNKETTVLPKRDTVGTTTAYLSVVEQGCDSPRKKLSVTINPTPTLDASNIIKIDATCQSKNGGRITFDTRHATLYSINNGVSWQSDSVFRGLKAGTYYVKSKLGDCSSETLEVTIDMKSTIAPGGISGSKTICYNTSAGTITSTGSASGGDIENSYSWEYRTTGDWTPIPDAHDVRYIPPFPLTETTKYRRKVENTCDGYPVTAYSDSVTITVNPMLAAPASLTADFICSGTRPTISFTGKPGITYSIYTVRSGGSPIDSLTINAIKDTTINTLVSDTPAYSRKYYVQASSKTSGIYCVSARDSVEVTVYPIPELPPTLKSIDTCYDGNTYVVGIPTLPSRQEIHWYVDSIGSALVDGLPLERSAFGETYAYVSIIDYDSNNGKGCESLQRTKISINIREELELNSSHIKQTDVTCQSQYGGSIEIINVNADVTHYSSDDGDSWQDSPTFTGLAVGEYKMRIKTTKCVSKMFSVTIGVDSISLKGGKISGNDTICYNTPAGTIKSDSAASGSGGETYSWESSTMIGENWTPWTTINVAGLEYTPSGNLTATTKYRRKVECTCSEVLQTAYSNEFTITVIPELSVPSSLSDVTICSGLQPVISFKGKPGITYNVYDQDGKRVDSDFSLSADSTIKITVNDTFTAKTTYQTTYHVEAQSWSCVSSPRSPVKVTVNKLPDDPNDSDEFKSVTACYDGNPHTVDVPTLPTGHEIIWYKNPSGTEETSKPSITNSGPPVTVYVAVRDIVTGCESPRKLLSVAVGEKLQLSASNISKTDVTCEALGAIKVNVDATAYSIDNGANWQQGNSSFDNLQADTFYVKIKESETCVSDAVPVIIGPASLTVPPRDPVTVCSGKNPVISFIGEVGVIYKVYTKISDNDPIISRTGDGSAINITVPETPLSDTIYYIEASSASCVSSREKVQVKVNPFPPVPDYLLDNTPVCNDGQYHQIDTSGIPSDQTIVWYTSEFGTETTDIPRSNTTGSTSAYAAAKFLSTGCESELRKEVTLTINAKPYLTSSLVMDSIISGDAVAYNVADSTKTAVTYSWSRTFVDDIIPPSAGGENISIDTPITEKQLTNKSLEFRTVTYQITLKTANGCDSVQNVTLTVVPTYSLAETSKEICSGASVAYKPDSDTTVLSITSYSWIRTWTAPGISPEKGPSSETYNSPINEVLTNTTSVPLNVTYRVGYSINGSWNTQDVTITVKSHATADDIIVTGDSTICKGTRVELHASLAAGSNITNPIFRWHDTPTGTSSFLADGDTYSVDPMSTTTYYVSVEGDNYCDNEPGDRKEVTVEVMKDYATADAIDIADTIFTCLNSETVLEVSSSLLAPVFKWYLLPDSEEPFHTGNRYIIPYRVLKADTAFWVSVSGEGYCENPPEDRKKIVLKIDPVPSFSDNIWYFGKNSQGMRFIDNGDGVYSVTDASGISNVDSRENALSVSSPYCEEQILFYTKHSNSRLELYNSLHTKIDDLAEVRSPDLISDGLAACYVDSNRYLIFAVTNAYAESRGGGTDRALHAYTVDMNANFGRGAIVGSNTVEALSEGMSESVELVSSSDGERYWLIYAYRNNGKTELRVSSFSSTLTGPFFSAGTHLTKYPSLSVPTSSETTLPYTLKASPQLDRIAVANGEKATVDVFDFNNTTGVLTNRRTSPTSSAIQGIAYGIEFSPDGNQLYAAGYTTGGAESSQRPMLYQYTIEKSTLVPKFNVQYWSYNGPEAERGGGLKLGPDGKIYVMRAYNEYVGVISEPNSGSSLSVRYNPNGLKLNTRVEYSALQFSTGLTKPAIVKCNFNNAPLTNPDSVTLCVSESGGMVKANVLANDRDADNNPIFITDVHFVNVSDTALASLAVTERCDSVILTVKPNVDLNLFYNHSFYIEYTVKDAGALTSKCSTGRLVAKVYSTKFVYPDLRVHVCPEAVTGINLLKYIDDASIQKVQWSGSQVNDKGEVTIPTGSSQSLIISYKVRSLCASEQTRKIYLDILHGRTPRIRKDTMTVCCNLANMIHINQIFGIEAGGSWKIMAKDSLTSNALAKYVTELPNGAIFLDGKNVYKDSNIGYYTYRGNNSAKRIDVIYTPNANSCLKGKVYRMVIIIEN